MIKRKILAFYRVALPSVEVELKLRAVGAISPFFSISPRDKAILAAIWLFKLIIDYDIAKPGHRGKIYVLTKKVSFEIGELIIIGVQLIPAVVYLVVTVLMGAWIAFVPGVIGIVYCLFSFISALKDLRNTE